MSLLDTLLGRGPLIAEDLVVGEGSEATSGCRAVVHYSG